MTTVMVTLGLAGASGSLLMFAADLILYFPSHNEHRTALHYFTFIDPGSMTKDLAVSSMQYISQFRLMLGGTLGPVAAALYAVGFMQLLYGMEAAGSVLPAVSSFCLALTMILGGVYHACFSYTGFLSKAIAACQKGSGTQGETRSLLSVVEVHQAYLKFVYKFAAASGILGSLAFVSCVLTRETLYPAWTALFAPALSAPIKKLLKRRSIGGLVLCGGLTNLWNLLFFITITVSATRSTSDARLVVISLAAITLCLSVALYLIIKPQLSKRQHTAGRIT